MFQIIRGGRTREIELPEAKLGIRGFFKVDLIEARTGKIKRHLEFPNLITNAALDAIGNGGYRVNGGVQYLAVGTNNIAPAATDTTLGAELGRTNSNGGIADVVGFSGTAYAFSQYTRLFTEAQVNGNLTELGMLDSAAGGILFARQLFKDGSGNPTTITKTASDQLRIVYERRVYIPADFVGQVNVSGTLYDCTIRAIGAVTGQCWDTSNANGFGGGLGTWTPLGATTESNALVAQTGGKPASTAATSCTAGAYVNGNHYIDITTVFDPGIANFPTGIGSVWLAPISNSYYGFQTAFTTTKIPKDNTKRFTYVQRISWAVH